MNPSRRLLLRGALPAATLSFALLAGLLRPSTAWARLAQPEASTPAGKIVLDLFQSLRTAQPIHSNDIRIIAPTIAEDGASVYMECSTTLPEVDGFVVFVDRNPQPLIASFWIGPNVSPEFKTRIKLSQTANIWVIARSRGHFFKANNLVKVTRGGCGVGLN